ncbi:hypothetical protein HETIRDRAFT_305610, partial [Heterobasidion irregulare TC 32-1]
SMSSQSSDIPSFFEDELKKALREQTYGIDSSKLLGSTALDATAEITIIEGTTIKVMLFTSGFQVSPGGSALVGMIFETLEELLLAVSPLYAAKQGQELLARLEQLSNKP